MLLEVVLLGLGVVALVDLAKLVIPAPVPGAWKLIAVAVLAATAAMVFADSFRDWVLLWTGVTGGASFLHSLQRLLAAVADEKRLNVLLNTTPGRRRVKI